ncbi:MAG TPA: hypothetical protein VK444_02490 [Methanobacteriaceae archaeon]|nr:hypothetical protein [Methanobacteriaceae archaeon]
MIVKFRKSSGNKKKGEDLLEVKEEHISLQDRQEAALVINFKASEEKIKEISEFFTGPTDLEPIYMDLDDTGEVEYYFRGTTSPHEDGDIFKFSVTLQLKR